MGIMMILLYVLANVLNINGFISGHTPTVYEAIASGAYILGWFAAIIWYDSDKKIIFSLTKVYWLCIFTISLITLICNICTIDLELLIIPYALFMIPFSGINFADSWYVVTLLISAVLLFLSTYRSKNMEAGQV